MVCQTSYVYKFPAWSMAVLLWQLFEYYYYYNSLLMGAKKLEIVAAQGSLVLACLASS